MEALLDFDVINQSRHCRVSECIWNSIGHTDRKHIKYWNDMDISDGKLIKNVK